jgi:putative flippase GtrA
MVFRYLNHFAACFLIFGVAGLVIGGLLSLVFESWCGITVGMAIGIAIGVVVFFSTADDVRYPYR